MHLDGIDASSQQNFEAALSFFRRAENLASSIDDNEFANELMRLRVQIEMKHTATLFLEADLKSRIMAEEHLVRADNHVDDNQLTNSLPEYKTALALYQSYDDTENIQRIKKQISDVAACL